MQSKVLHKDQRARSPMSSRPRIATLIFFYSYVSESNAMII